MSRVLLVHPDDDMVVALQDHQAGETISLQGESIQLTGDVSAKHKFARRSAKTGEKLRMYGIIVAEATCDIRVGDPLTTKNLRHATGAVETQGSTAAWNPPDVSRWENETFLGYRRPDGRVGTRNYWIVVPLVFCQNRNVDVLRESLVSQLGYARPHRFRSLTERLIELHDEGASPKSIREASLTAEPLDTTKSRLFPHVDGIKFLTHDGGCGGLYEDARTLCGLLAGYINHPNVAGATVMSLGCQKSQIATLEEELGKRNSDLRKRLFILEQQQEGTEDTLLDKALRYTFSGIVEANTLRREPAHAREITLGVECGGSDGFSGISANPAIGHCSDLLVALGGAVILSEFPELAGCESDLTSRCQSPALAERFLQIMSDYDRRATKDGGGFDQNPSPGNVRDGLITDAMKSAGAAKKGGSSPVVDVLDYPEPQTKPGLNLLCTPGGDVESTTAMAGSGANIQVFSTGLGTPTGNPVTPVLKISTNTILAERMPDIIDLDAGGIVSGAETIEEVGARMLDMILRTASGIERSKAECLGQDDFIPWKRGITF
jgi:altronate hydrolase